VYPVEAAEFALGGDQLGDSQNGSSVEIDDPVLSGAASNFVATNSGVQYSFSPTALTITQGFDRVEQRVDVGVLVRLAVSEPVPSRIGRRSIRRARVLVRKPHTQRRQRLIRAIAVGTVRVERRYNMQPSAAAGCV
jgi:hypothetical protein